MGIDINTFTNEKIIQAAQTADSQCTNGGNGMLDSAELSIFIVSAVSLKCDIGEIMDVVNSVGFTKDDKNIKNMMTTMKKIENIEKKISQKKAKLLKKENKYIKFQNRNSKLDGFAAVLGFMGWITESIVDSKTQHGIEARNSINGNDTQNNDFYRQELQAREDEIKAIKTEISNLENEKSDLLKSLY